MFGRKKAEEQAEDDPALAQDAAAGRETGVPSEGRDVADGTDGTDGTGEGDDENARTVIASHRFGLRLGHHQADNLLTKLKTVLGRSEAVEAAEAEAQEEEEEAVAEVIQPDERYKEIETYPIHPPYAYIRILFDDERKEYIYQVLEPALTRTEKEILDFIEDTLVDNLQVSPEELQDVDELAYVTDRFNDVIFDYSIILHEDEAEEEAIKKKLLYYIRRNFIGHGPVDALMEDPFIEDISCDGPDVPVFLYHRKYESLRSTVVFGSHEALDAYVIKMAQRSGKHISIAEPILDATMADGSRLQSTLGKEVSAAGSTFTIRKFRPDPFTPPDLVLFRTMSAEMLAYLWIAVQNGASCLYAGGTASGKTTSLNAILLFIPPQMKIVSIEDTREVNLPHENWIAGITRTGFGPRDQYGRQAGEIDMFQLLKNALRQRPEYIIVGEVRGQEAYSLFQAMATGHAAYGTMHADSVDAVIHRLESDPINIPRSLLEALDIVSVQIQTRVGGKRVRRTKQISEIVGLDPHTREILTNEVFRWVPKDDSFKFSGVSYILERIQLEKGMPAGSMVKELKRRAEIIQWLIERQIQDYQDVSKVVSAYYKEPETVMDLIHGRLAPEQVPPGLRALAFGEPDEREEGLLSARALADVAGIESEEGKAQAAGGKTPPGQEGAAAAEEAPKQWAQPADEDDASENEPATKPAATVASGTRAAPTPTSQHAGTPQPESTSTPTRPPTTPPASSPPTAESAKATEKAQDWAGMDALLGSAEAEKQKVLDRQAEARKASHKTLDSERANEGPRPTQAHPNEPRAEPGPPSGVPKGSPPRQPGKTSPASGPPVQRPTGPSPTPPNAERPKTAARPTSPPPGFGAPKAKAGADQWLEDAEGETRKARDDAAAAKRKDAPDSGTKVAPGQERKKGKAREGDDKA